MFDLLKVRVQLVCRPEEQRFHKLMQTHHYLGALPKISETLWYEFPMRKHCYRALS